MQPYITHRAHTLDTISCQTHWIDGHLAMHSITYLLPSPPPSLSLPAPTWYDHTMHTQKVAHLVQTHTKVRKRAPIFSTGWMVLGSTGGGRQGPLWEGLASWVPETFARTLGCMWPCADLPQLHWRETGGRWGVGPEGFFLGSQSLSAFK